MPPMVLENGCCTTPDGWRAAVAACGIKYHGRNDLALLVSDTPCTAAALFTTNQVQSAHIHYDREVLAHHTADLWAVLINSGSANACTGDAGVAVARTMAQSVEHTLDLPAFSTLVMSTGVIGLPIPVEKVSRGISEAAQRLDAGLGTAAAQAIMTTDTYHKQCAVQVELSSGARVTIGGMAKGAGMIHPNMATLLSVVTTDAAVAPAALDAGLRYVADRSFHCISVDGDTSTNDTLMVLANGQAGNVSIDDIASPDGHIFLEGLLTVCQRLAQEVARDGEGATRFVTVRVSGAPSYAEAHRAAMTVARSPLVKTALFGADPNWGRVVCALGYSGVPFDPEHLVLSFGGIRVFEGGVPLDFDELAAQEVLDTPEVTIEADLGRGHDAATVWTCDFSYDYIKINAEYRT